MQDERAKHSCNGTQALLMSDRLRMAPEWLKAIAWVAVAACSFIVAQVLLGLGVHALLAIGIVWDVNSAVSMLTLRLVMYGLMIATLLGVVWCQRRKLTLADVNLKRLLEWRDIGLSLAGSVLYVLLSLVALTIARYVPGFNSSQTQDLGFSPHLYGGNLLIAFIVLVVLTPFFEEVIFRGFLYGRLRRLQRIPWWISAIIVSFLFGLAHMQWNVGIDVFCLSLVACALCELTDSIWAGILLHVMKNLLAFLVTFVFIQGGLS